MAIYMMTIRDTIVDLKHKKEQQKHLMLMHERVIEDCRVVD